MPEGNLFRTKGRTGVSAGDPPVQESSSLEAQAADRPAVQESVRPTVPPSRRPGVQESSSTDIPPSTFTWKQAPAQALALDGLMLTLRQQLGRSPRGLDKRDALWALVELAIESDEWRAALLRKLRGTT